MKWSTVPFEHLYKIPSKNGLNRPSRVRGNGYKMINMGELFANDRIGAIDMERVQLNEREFENMLVESGDLLFARQSLVLAGAGKCSIVKTIDEPITFESHLIRVRLKSEIANPDFYRYYFKSPISPMKSIVTQGVQAGIRASDLAKLDVHLLPITTQNKIADILSTYDDLIENNRRRIDLLEQSARMLYKEWFVSLRFPGHEHVKVKDGVPQGWEVKKIGDCFHMPGGFSFKSGTYQSSGKYGIVTIKNVQDSKFEPKCSGYIDEVPDGLPQHCHLTTGDLLMSLTGNVGRVCIVYGENYLLNQRVAKIIPQSGISKYYAYWTFTNDGLRKIIENLAYGVAQLNLSASKVQSLDWILPTHQLLDLFDNYTSGIFEEIYTLNLANEKLKEARDLLLPRLMNGEIPV